MQKNPYPGKFMVFEGLDGAGSSTEAAKLCSWLNETNKDKFSEGVFAHLTKEPTNNLIGGIIRAQLTSVWQSNSECLQLLFAADRSFHLEKEIVPLLKKGVTVVSDRYFLSTIAYGASKIKDFEWLVKINEPFLLPDLIFLIKASPKTCLERIRKNRSSFELFEEEKILASVWNNYERLASRFENVFLIDGEKPADEVFSEIKKVVVSNMAL